MAVFAMPLTESEFVIKIYFNNVFKMLKGIANSFYEWQF